MELTRYLPTDRYGNIYYGPSTYAEAVKEIEYVAEAYEHNGRPNPYHRAARAIADNLDAAGYVGVAARVRREYLS